MPVYIQTLHGDIAELSLWDSLLPESLVADLAGCRRSSEGNVFHLGSADVERFGDVQEVVVDVEYFCRYGTLQVVLLYFSSAFGFVLISVLVYATYYRMGHVSHSVRIVSPCRPSEHVVVVAKYQSFFPLRTTCRLLNASLPVPRSQEENDRLMDEFEPFLASCSPGSIYKLWLGIRDEIEEGTWVDGDTAEPLAFLNFRHPFPNGGRRHSCAHMLDLGTWADVPCSVKTCGACSLARSDFLFLRGLCFDKEHESYFRLDGYADGRPLFRGYYHHAIAWQQAERRWLLRDLRNNKSVAGLGMRDEARFPLGHHVWLSMGGGCVEEQTAEIPLSLSICANQQFMCRSGHCIDHAYRCNLRYECQDGSDEDECDIVAVNSAYRRHLPPRGTGDTALELTPSLVLTRVASVDDMEMALDLEFLVAQTWRDDRLLFRHLHVANKTLIPEREVSRIWTPRILILNVEGGQMKHLDSSVVILSAENASLPDFNSIRRGY